MYTVQYYAMHIGTVNSFSSKNKGREEREADVHVENRKESLSSVSRKKTACAIDR